MSLLRCTDDREQRVTLHPRAIQRLGVIVHPPEGWSRWRWARSLLGQWARRGTLVVFVGALMFTGVMGGLVFAEGTGGAYLLVFSPILVSMLAAVLFLMVAAGRAARSLAAQAAQASLAVRRCPSCDYDLAAAEALGPDTLATCPECGSAWRSVRLGLRRMEDAQVVIVKTSA